MPKSLTLGNGKILVGLDRRAQVRDFYFPHVGLENHISGSYVHRVGVWADGKLRWFDDPSWNISVVCGDESLSGKSIARNDELALELSFNDIVYNEKDIFIRAIEIKNLRTEKRTVKIFFGHEFRISESRRGDTGYFDPRCQSIIHYKGKRVFLINARTGGKPFDDYGIGLFEIEGKEGSYLDAEDGILSKNPIEHGSVDSVMGVSCTLESEGSCALHYWIAAADSIKAAHALNEYVLEKTPEHLVRTATDFWKAWVNKQNFTFYGLPVSVITLFKKSLLLVRAHVDDGGAIIASGDSDMLQHGRDTYSYMWPRDGALSALALDRAGDFNVARRFFEFSNDVISKEGYFMHKYLPDRSLGSSWHPWIRNGKPELPIQEDETALVLFALSRHYELSRDIEFIEGVYNSLIKKAADFLVQYSYKDTGLPYPSYDLWEEKYGITTFTCGAKYAALLSAAKFARLLGKTDSEKEYADTAEKVKKAILTHLYRDDVHMFAKLVNVKNGKMEYDLTLDMSSIYGIFKFGVLPPDDQRVLASIQTIEEKLALQGGTIGGVPRYENDKYYRIDGSLPPNPWFITTLWLAQYYSMAAKKEKDLDRVKDMLLWAVKYALPSGVLSEQLHPLTGEQLSAAPLTWSHSEFVVTVIEYLEKLEELGVCKACYPIK